MTNILKQKICIQWTVQTSSTYGSSIESEKFTFQGRKLNLKFWTGYRRSGNRFYVESDRELDEKVEVVVIIHWYKGPSLLEKNTFKGTVITWDLVPETGGCQVTFDVIIYADLLKEDKCLQTASYLNPKVPEESLFKDFSEIFLSGLKNDVEINCRGQSLRAHKIVLCARSDVFKAMLQNSMLEGQTGIVEIQDMDVSCVKDFLRYLYTDVMPELTFDTAKTLYEAGDKYDIKSLMLRCSEFLQDNLTPENAFQCFQFADAHSDQTLQENIKIYIIKEKVYLQKENWLPFCECYPNVAIEVYRSSYENITESKDV